MREYDCMKQADVRSLYETDQCRRIWFQLHLQQPCMHQSLQEMSQHYRTTHVALPKPKNHDFKIQDRCKLSIFLLKSKTKVFQFQVSFGGMDFDSHALMLAKPSLIAIWSAISLPLLTFCIYGIPLYSHFCIST